MTDVSLTYQVLFMGGGIIASVATTWGVMRVQIKHLEGQVAETKKDAADVRADLADFKLEAARTFVSAGALAKLEGQMEAGFAAIRQELRDTNATIVAAILSQHGPSGGRTRPGGGRSE